jgi:hypothetical protein
MCGYVLFFHTVPKLVHALVVTYDESFQAQAVEGDFPLPKPFLDLGFDGVVRWTWLPRTSTCLANSKKNLQGQRFLSDDTVKAEVHKSLWEQEVSFNRQGLETLIVRYDESQKTSEEYVEIWRTGGQPHLRAFLVYIYPHSAKK